MKQALLISIFLTLVAGAVFTEPAFAQQTIKVKAQVGGVVAGPSSEDDSDNDDNGHDNSKKKSTIPIVSQPAVSLEPSTLRGSRFSLVKGVPQFTTSRPTFQGTTNIQYANIALVFSFGNFTIKAFTQAKADGSWTFVSSDDFPNGTFQVTVSAVHPTEPSIKSESSRQFSVLTNQDTPSWSERFSDSSQGSLFTLKTNIQEEYQVVAPGENIIVGIELINQDSNQDSTEILLEYSIQNEAGQEILRQQETVVVDTKLSYFKTFYTQPDLPEGVYHLVVKAPSSHTLTLATTEFVIEGKSGLALTPLAKIDYTAVLVAVGAVFFTFIFLSYFEFIRFLKVKKHIRLVTSKFLKKFF